MKTRIHFVPCKSKEVVKNFFFVCRTNPITAFCSDTASSIFQLFAFETKQNMFEFVQNKIKICACLLNMVHLVFSVKK